jgi:glycosyltransferase involved in cell wall biosynthesis
MTKKMIEVKPHILIINNTSIYTGLMGFSISLIMNKKLLVEYNDLQALYAIELLKDKFTPNMINLVKTGLIINEDMIVKNGWRVTAITDFIKNYAEKRNTRKDITVIPDGVDTSQFDPDRVNRDLVRKKYGIQKNTGLCVYAGRIEKAAGALILLDTVKELSNEQDIKFLIIGEGDPNIVKELHSYNNTIFTGRIPKDDVPEHLAAADVILVPFPPSIASNSISPLKLFEALSMNIPVVASDVSGIHEVISEEMEAVLAKKDAKSWAEGVKYLLQRRKQKITVRNRELVKKEYDWKELSRKLVSVLES